MNSFFIKINNIQQLRKFVDDCSTIDAEIEVASGYFTADAKSLLGMMSLRLSEPLKLRVISSNEKMGEVFRKLSEYRLTFTNNEDGGQSCPNII